MKEVWKEPKLGVLDIKETMLGWKKNAHDLIFEDFSDEHGWIDDGTGEGPGGS